MSNAKGYSRKIEIGGKERLIRFTVPDLYDFETYKRGAGDKNFSSYNYALYIANPPEDGVSVGLTDLVDLLYFGCRHQTNSLTQSDVIEWMGSEGFELGSTIKAAIATFVECATGKKVTLAGEGNEELEPADGGAEKKPSRKKTPASTKTAQ